ncbi:MAG: flavin-dependent oxidoreductase [Pseudonocardiales bacterium]|nr:MAG: flavin-dependent oxidoreductase [Pseudonocardiales bacterium]
MRIIITGAGIGGLVAALSLRAAGFDEITLLESAPEIRPIGVGLNILPNAIRELDELGVAERLYEIAVSTGSLSYYNRFGSVIWTEPRGISAGYHWPQLSIHRGRLQGVLLETVRERLGADAIISDARVTEFESTPDGGVQVAVAHRVGGNTRMCADLLVGADGIHSAVRAVMYPREGGPRWNQLVVWRGTTWAKPFLDGRTMIIAGDRCRRAVVYPMSTPIAPGAPVLTNWAVARRAEEGQIPNRADWNRAVEPERFLANFADLAFGWLDVPGLIRSADQALEYPMVDRDPLPRWACGRATLLGDAAHAMNPMGSNGATQSIVDGRVLAKALAGHRDLNDALLIYEAERRPAMTALQETNRRMGPEVIIDLADERAPGGFDLIEQVIPVVELAEISQSYADLGAGDPHTVNTRPSFSVTPVTAAGGGQV